MKDFEVMYNTLGENWGLVLPVVIIETHHGCNPVHWKKNMHQSIARWEYLCSDYYV